MSLFELVFDTLTGVKPLSQKLIVVLSFGEQGGALAFLPGLDHNWVITGSPTH